MAISFFAYHGSADQRRVVIDQIARHMKNGHLANATASGEHSLCLISALADGQYDLAAAHQQSGFPTLLLFVAEAIFEGLAPEDAPHFALALVKAAAIDTDLADVGWAFAEWMFADAVAELGPSRVRTMAKDAGPVFTAFAESGNLTHGQQQKAKALAKRMRRRGLEAPTPNERLVSDAVSALLDSGMEHVSAAIHWIAKISPQPSDQYRRYARKLLELVETA